jgi:hypothetical protein
MKWHLLDTSDPEAWREALRPQPVGDIYFQPEYHQAYEVNGDGSAKAFVAEDGSHRLVYPFMLRSIEKVACESLGETWFDMETVYGYGGPLSTTSNRDFLSAAWNCFGSWCEENRVIAEFIRFHPMIDNYRFADPSCVVSADRETVIVDLNSTEDDIWKSYSVTHRRKIRKAQKNLLMCEEQTPAEGIAHFKKIYKETMNRVGARDYYYFSDNYFDALMESLDRRLRLFLVRSGKAVVAAALFFLSGDYIHYHLGGSVGDAMSLGPMPLLLHTVAVWGRQHGCRSLHLGGGTTPDPRDSLFTFKASISKLRRTYYTGRRIRNPEAFEKLCSLWMSRARATMRPNYFLLYRLDVEEYASRNPQ